MTKGRFLYVQLISLFALCCLFEIVSAGIEDRKYEPQRLALVTDIQHILIDNRVCASVQDCQSKKLMFVSPADNGIAVQLWSIKNAVALEQIIRACAHLFLTGVQNITVDVFAITKDEGLRRPFWKSSKPAMSIKFEGEK